MGKDAMIEHTEVSIRVPVVVSTGLLRSHRSRRGRTSVHICED